MYQKLLEYFEYIFHFQWFIWKQENMMTRQVCYPKEATNIPKYVFMLRI